MTAENMNNVKGTQGKINPPLRTFLALPPHLLFIYLGYLINSTLHFSISGIYPPPDTSLSEVLKAK